MMARSTVAFLMVGLAVYCAAKKSKSGSSYSGSSSSSNSNPTPRPTNRPTTAERTIFVGYNITGLDSDDFDILDTSTERTEFEIMTKAGMRSSIRDGDANFDDANGNSDPDTWAIFINQNHLVDEYCPCI